MIPNINDSHHTILATSDKLSNNVKLDIDHAGQYLILANVGSWVGNSLFFYIHWLQ